jgi:hypothetical protein
MKRRDFVQICAAAASGATLPAAPDFTLAARDYARAGWWTNAASRSEYAISRSARTTSRLPVSATPYFLLRLHRPCDGETQLHGDGFTTNEGGGPTRVVAFGDMRP